MLPQQTSAAAPDACARRWYTGKGHEHFGVAYRRKAERTKRGYSDEQLKSALARYATGREALERSRRGSRWEALFAFKAVLEARTGARAAARVAGADDALYEQLFRAQPRKYLQRTRYLAVMRVVYGLDVAPTDHAADALALRALNRLYNAFDVRDADEADWRQMVYMMQVAARPHETLDASLRFAFALLGSEGAFDAKCADPVPLSSLLDMAGVLASHDTEAALRTILEEGWLEIVQKDPEAGAACEAARAADRGPMSVLITRRMLDELLDSYTLAPLLRVATLFGRKDRRAWTFAGEERYFDPVLRELLRQTRRDKRNAAALAVFKTTVNQRRAKFNMLRWRRFVRRRRRARELVTAIADRFFWGYASIAVARWRRLAVCAVAAEAVQRVYRGHEARRQAHFLRALHAVVARLQAIQRGRAARMRYLRYRQKRQWAAAEIQRLVRGAQARGRATRLLREAVERQLLKVDEAVERWQWSVREAAAGRIQRKWHRHRVIEEHARRQSLMVKAAQVEQEMAGIAAARRRQIATYKAELSEWYAQQRRDLMQARMTESSTAAEKYKIVQYRRREADRLKKEAADRRAAKEARMEQERKEVWARRWAEVTEERAIARSAYLAQVLMHPETSEEAALRAGLQAEIKAESKAVIKLADDQRIDLEWPEAMEIAKEQVLKRRMDEERRQVKKEMQAAAKALEIEEAAAEAERKTLRLAAMNALSEGAASKIQRVYAQYRAREYVRRLAMATYEKHFDVASGAYWWSNPLIKTVSWAKPPLLGAYDVDPPDEWAVMPGAYDLVYYYNPRMFAMSWTVPEGTVPCGKCNAYFATRLAPGWAPGTAADPPAFCDYCYDLVHFWEARGGGAAAATLNTYRIIPGAGAGSLFALLRGDYEEIEPVTAEPPEGWAPPQHLLGNSTGVDDGGGSDGDTVLWQGGAADDFGGDSGGFVSHQDQDEYAGASGIYYYEQHH
eukprot:TRINITY_DN1205_c0_g1_i3.p1 TRINITY_DN1205_c0_g1~~TRINITY_DN1205_c0_g1_i3.p1  ORF type:complete len:965 (+),score=381.04 TRINITY_DN1205_c0_g1_i3:181-3075(+)